MRSPYNELPTVYLYDMVPAEERERLEAEAETADGAAGDDAEDLAEDTLEP